MAHTFTKLTPRQHEWYSETTTIAPASRLCERASKVPPCRWSQHASQIESPSALQNWKNCEEQIWSQKTMLATVGGDLPQSLGPVECGLRRPKTSISIICCLFAARQMSHFRANPRQFTACRLSSSDDGWIYIIQLSWRSSISNNTSSSEWQ